MLKAALSDCFLSIFQAETQCSDVSSVLCAKALPLFLQVLASRYHLYTAAPAADASLQPLEQLRCDMVLAVQLASALDQFTAAYLPPAAVQMEMLVAAMLAHMESVGMGEC